MTTKLRNHFVANVKATLTRTAAHKQLGTTSRFQNRNTVGPLYNAKGFQLSLLIMTIFQVLFTYYI